MEKKQIAPVVYTQGGNGGEVRMFPWVNIVLDAWFASRIYTIARSPGSEITDIF